MAIIFDGIGSGGDGGSGSTTGVGVVGTTVRGVHLGQIDVDEVDSDTGFSVIRKLWM